MNPVPDDRPPPDRPRRTGPEERLEAPAPPTPTGPRSPEVAASGHVRRDYRSGEIVVHWDSARCVHSANCLEALPEVFDVRRRPWVHAGAATVDRVAGAVDTCPSRALTYTRLDGRAPGPNGTRPSPDEGGGSTGTGESGPHGGTTGGDGPPEVVIALKPDGPLVVEGPVRIERARGEAIEVTDHQGPVVLCRCGSSGRKPFCDGSHRSAGFVAEGW